jgi:quercetin dioxygenase-like cupin family protein
MNSNRRDNRLIPARTLHTMLNDVAPQLPGADTARRIKRNALRRVTAAPVNVPHAIGWRPFVARTEMKVLFDDGVCRSWLVRMHPASELPPHAHDVGDEECVVVQGEVWVNGLRYGPGDYTAALRGSTHHSVRTITGALFFLRSPSPHASAARGEGAAWLPA